MGALTYPFIKNPKLAAGRYGDGSGLYLLVKPTGAKSWLLRVQDAGKRRDIGLGSLDLSARSLASPIEIPILSRKSLTLSEAREKSAILRAAAKAGLNPVVERDRQRNKVPTFREAAKDAHAALSKGWSAKGAKTFLASLENHAFGGLGDLRVNEITSADITGVLEPIWTTKTDMARKVRQRIGTVLNFAHSKGWRPTEAPGRSVTVGLAKQPKGENYAAMPYADVPAFVARLRSEAETTGRRALLLQILTAARPGEIRGARWGQIDFAKANWNRPSELMKGRNAPPHTVTLNTAAVALLKEIVGDRKTKPDDLVFAGQKGGKLSDMTLAKVLRTADQPYDAHGFRSSFRDWAAEQMPLVPDPVAEAALAHAVPDAVIAAYKRTTFPQMRRELLEAWGTFVTSQVVPA